METNNFLLKNASGTRADWKEVGYEHYLKVYAELKLEEAASRCALPLEGGKLRIRFMGEEYGITHPEFSMTALEGAREASLPERMLVLRYLCEGKWTPAAGKTLSYREVPWGETYFANFDGRCLKRLARMYGVSPEAFCAYFENAAFAVKLEKKTGWRFEFMTGLHFEFIIWEGDDEFPTQAQILFDDNIPAAFSAEDLAVAGDCALSRIKTAMSSAQR